MTIRAVIEVRCNVEGCERRVRASATMNPTSTYDGRVDLGFDDVEFDEPGWTGGDLENMALCPEHEGFWDAGVKDRP